MLPQSPAPSKSSLFASSSSPSTLLAHTTTTQSRVVGLPSHLAAPPASSGYTAVPLVHQHQTHHSHNNNTNSSRDNDSQEGLFSSGSPAVIGAPSTSQPRSSSHQQQPSQQRSTIDADQQQRALRWHALGVNVDAILGQQSPLIHTPAAMLPPQRSLLFSPQPQSVAIMTTTGTESSSATAHRQLVALSRAIEEARQEQSFEPTVQKGGRGGGGRGGGAPFWARKRPASHQNNHHNNNKSAEAAAAAAEEGGQSVALAQRQQQQQQQQQQSTAVAPHRITEAAPKKRQRSPSSPPSMDEEQTDDITMNEEDLPNEVREPVVDVDDDEEESLEAILEQLESGTRSAVAARPTVTVAKAPAAMAPGKKSRGNGEPKQRKQTKAAAPPPAAAAKRTLFKIGASGFSAPPGSHNNGALSSASSSAHPISSVASSKVIRDRSVAELLLSIDQELNDANRIQSLLIGVVVLAAGGQHNSFSIPAMANSASAAGFTSGPTVCHRKRLLQLVDGFLIVWRDDLILLSSNDGLELLQALDRNGSRGSSDVDVVVWDASSILLPLFAHVFTKAESRCAVSPPHPLDVRIMGWMLDPSDACADFDALVLRHMPPGGAAARLSSFPMTTFEGACDRAVQLILLYRRLYAAIGSKGLLQSLLKQERSTTYMCALMKFDGFSVDVSQLEELKQSARDAAAVLQEEALSLVKPGMMEINLQSPDDCREALYGVLNLGRFLSATDSSSSGGDAAVVTKGGKLSTAEEVLRKLSPHHRLPLVILEHRKINKILQTYIEGILEGNAVAIDDDDRFCAEIGYSPYERDNIDEFLISSGDAPEIHRLSTSLSRKEKLRRVHASFLQYGTDTGRLSCVDPNLQNLPRTGDIDVVTTTSTTIGSASDGDGGGGGHHPPASSSVASVLTSSVRRAFVPLPGCDLVAFDYEQIELRVLAHLSNDAQLVDALGGHSGSGLHGLMHAGATAIGGEATARGATTGGAQEIDIHRKIAAVIFRKQNPTQVTKEERTQAKRVVFGVLYGMGPRALAAQLNETFEHALYIQNAFKQGFPHLEKYHARVVAQCRQENGVVRTLCGRIRTLVDINDSNQSKRSLAERQAFNTVIQGSAADVVKRAMSAVYDHVLQDAEFRGRIRLHCQVHDELVFSIPREFLHRAIVRIQECMTSCILLSVPLRVAVQVGCSYGSLVPYHQKGAS